MKHLKKFNESKKNRYVIMKYLKKFESFSINEEKIYGVEVLPKDALEELKGYVDYKNPENKIEVYPDPKVDGTYAVRVYRKHDDYTFDLLWYKGGYDELDFDNWPPISGNLKFFI